MTAKSPEQVVADAFSRFRSMASSQYASRLDEAGVAVEALRDAGYAVVKLPDECIIPTGWGHDCLGAWPVTDFRDPVSAWPRCQVAMPDGDFITSDRARALAVALLAAANAAEAQ